MDGWWWPTPTEIATGVPITFCCRFIDVAIWLTLSHVVKPAGHLAGRGSVGP